MKQREFIDQVVNAVRDDKTVIGLAVAGSFITDEVDEFSDVDLILITTEKISNDFDRMERYAKSFGDYLSGFTGEHVGERRLLICLYDNPLLHVDIKFLTIDEFRDRIEDPVILLDREGKLKEVLQSSQSQWPKLDFQWIEDRFWTWVHYATSKLGRGENFEALDFLSFLRMSVISPLLQVKNGKLPRGLRKVEVNFPLSDLGKLVSTVPSYSTVSLFDSLASLVNVYIELRQSIFPSTVRLRSRAEERSLAYLEEIRKLKLK